MLTNTERPKCPTIGVGGGGGKRPPSLLTTELVRRRNFRPLTSHGASLSFRQNNSPPITFFVSVDEMWVHLSSEFTFQICS